MDFDIEIKQMHLRQGKDRKVAITVMFPPSIINEIDEEAAKHRLSRGDFLVSCFLRVKGKGDAVPVIREKPKSKEQLEKERADELNRRIEQRHKDGTFYDNPITVAEEMRLEDEARMGVAK